MTPDDDKNRVSFDWRLSADKPLLRWLSPIFKPVFEWNHKWAMDRGFESLNREVKRRLGQNDGLSAQA